LLLTSKLALYLSTSLPQTKHDATIFSLIRTAIPHSREQVICLLSFVPIGFPQFLQGLLSNSSERRFLSSAFAIWASLLLSLTVAKMLLQKLTG
jgi:hypothetical protein